MSHAVLLGSINPELIGVPQYVAKDSSLMRTYVIAQFGSRLEVALGKIKHHFVASHVLTMLSIKNDFWIEAHGHSFHISVIESDGAGSHVHFGCGKCVSGIFWITSHSADSDSPLQIDGHPHSIEQIHTPDPVYLPSTGLADRTQINGRELQIPQDVCAYLY
jgi:hypothetical protein